MAFRSDSKTFFEALDALDNVSGSDEDINEDEKTPVRPVKRRKKFFDIEGAKAVMALFPETKPLSPQGQSPISCRDSANSSSQPRRHLSSQSPSKTRRNTESLANGSQRPSGSLMDEVRHNEEHAHSHVETTQSPSPTNAGKADDTATQSPDLLDKQQIAAINVDGAQDQPEVDHRDTVFPESVEFLSSSSQLKGRSSRPTSHVYRPLSVQRAATTGTINHPPTRVCSDGGAVIPVRNSAARATRGRRKANATSSVTVNPGPRLFDDLTFCKQFKPIPAVLTFADFVPDDEVNVIRRNRIASGILNGAIRTRDPTQATHIVCDCDTPYDGLVRVLTKKWGHIDLTKIAAVQGTWLEQSIIWKDVLDVNQARFRLRGAPRPDTPPLWGRVDVSHSQSSQINDNESDLSPEQLHKSLVSTNPLPSSSQQPMRLSIQDDELEAIVQEFKAGKDMPLDDEDIEQFVSDDDEREAPPENRGFTCMQAHTGELSAANPNKRTMDILQQMATYYDRTGDNWRTLAYRKAISALKRQTCLISTRQQAISIKGIGPRLADKIEEIVTTNRLARLDHISNDPTDAVLQLFMGIHDVGLVQARKWMEQGFRTLDDLKSHATLSSNQKIGIEHYDDFQQRIPRREVKEHGLIVQKALHRIDRNLLGIIGGSYRRNMPDSGDIDIMITHPTADLSQLQQWLLGDAIPYMFATKFLKCALAVSRSRFKGDTPAKAQPATNMDSSGTKFLGASQLAKHLPWRRIDLLLVPNCSLGANLIYFTGNDIFNRSIRLLASRKGMRLNQHGLYKGVMRGPNRTKLNEGELVEGRSERRIFEILGVPYRQPWERRC